MIHVKSHKRKLRNKVVVVKAHMTKKAKAKVKKQIKEDEMFSKDHPNSVVASWGNRAKTKHPKTGAARYAIASRSKKYFKSHHVTGEKK